jgi:hypothetical protein
MFRHSWDIIKELPIIEREVFKKLTVQQEVIKENLGRPHIGRVFCSVSNLSNILSLEIH